MIAGHLAELELPYLELEDSCDKAMKFMDEFKLSHYPVVNGALFVGMIYEQDLYELDDWTKTIRGSKLRLPSVSVFEQEHFLTLVNKIQLSKLSCLPVIDEKNAFKGVITRHKIVNVFGLSSIVEDTGGVIEIEMASIDYSLADISRIVENNGLKILGSFIRNHTEENKIILTLKLNKQEVEVILNSLDRFGYTVMASYQSKIETTDLKNRYDNLMNYLNI